MDDEKNYTKDDVVYFYNEEDIDAFFVKKYLEGEELYNSYENQIQFIDDIYNELIILARELLKNGKKVSRMYKFISLRNRYERFISKKFNFTIACSEIDEIYLNFTLKIIQGLNILNNLTVALTYYIKQNKINFDKEICLNIYILFKILETSFINLAVEFNENINKLIYYQKGVTYTSKYKINQDIQIEYLKAKFTELGIINSLNNNCKNKKLAYFLNTFNSNSSENK